MATLDSLAEMILNVGRDVKDIRERVGGVEEDVKNVKDSVGSLETKMEKHESEAEDLKKQIKDLKSQFEEQNKMVQQVKTKPQTYSEVTSVLTGANTAPLGKKPMIETEHMNEEESQSDESKKNEILERARRTLGFGPIRKEDVERQFKECGRFGIANNEDDAKIKAVMELMLLDMKISKTELQKMDIIKVFAPRREGSEMLYCEFRNISSAYNVYKQTRVMRRGTNISPFIPKEFYERYRAMQEVCYRWRKEEGYRTKVRMGRKGLEVWRKIGDEMEYSEVVVDSLGELPPVNMHKRKETQEDRSLTSSPPAGRPGYTPPSARAKQGKRPRTKSKTESPSSRSPPNKKTDEREASLETNLDISPITKGLLKKPDIGQVINIQVSTPTKQIKKVANSIDNINSPIFRKISTSA